MTVAGMSFDWNAAGTPALPAPPPYAPIDTARFTVETNEGLIGIYDNQGGSLPVTVDGIPARPFLPHPTRPYSTALIPRLSLGKHTVVIELPGAPQGGEYTCSAKPEPVGVGTSVWYGTEDTGAADGSAPEHAIDWKRLERYNVSTSQVVPGISIGSNAHVCFANGVYKSPHRHEVLYIRAKNDVLIEGESEAGVIFDGSYPDNSFNWQFYQNGIYTAPLVTSQGETKSAYQNVIHNGIRCQYFHDMNDLIANTNRYGWTVDDTNIYVKIPGSIPDNDTKIARDVRIFHTLDNTRIKFDKMTIRHYRQRALRISNTSYPHVGENVRFEFIHQQAIFINNCPEPKLLCTTHDDNTYANWYQMKAGLDPWFTPSNQSTESTTAIVVQTSAGSETPSRRGYYRVTQEGGGDQFVLRDELADDALTLHEFSQCNWSKAYDNPFVDNRIAVGNCYIDCKTEGHDAGAEDSDGYGPILISGLYGIYGYENPSSIDADVNKNAETMWKRKGNYHQVIFHQCTFEPYNPPQADNNTRAVHTASSSLPFLEVTNCINVGRVLHDHSGLSGLVCDGNVYFQNETNIRPGESTPRDPFRYNLFDYANLGDWVSATGVDANSVETDPVLVNGVPTAPLPDAVPDPLNIHNRRGAF